MTKTTKALAASSPDPDLRKRARRLGLWGLLENWQSVAEKPWLPELIQYEEEERSRRSLERRIRSAKVGRFKPLADFDWDWPQEIDRELIEEIMTIDFASEAANVIIFGPNGVGKTMIAKNIVHRAILGGRTARFVTASELLNDLAAQETSSALLRRLRRYSYPEILAIDELGYLATSSEHADLLFEVITRRYQEKSIVLTANKAFTDWNEVFPSATCVVTMIDRLIHKSEIVNIKGESYRLKEQLDPNCALSFSSAKGPVFPERPDLRATCLFQPLRVDQLDPNWGGPVSPSLDRHCGWVIAGGPAGRGAICFGDSRFTLKTRRSSSFR